MSTRNRTPPILESYLRLPPELSLTLLTGTLGCSSSWLIARFVASALQNEYGVVLVSWMKDETFWRSQSRRVATSDLDKPDGSSRFVFVDRLSESLRVPSRTAAAELQAIESNIQEAIQTCEAAKVLLILDNPDALLAIWPDITTTQLNELILRLRTQPKTHIVLSSCLADLPRSNEQLTPLEINNTAFITLQAHMAYSVISVRDLETGSARDVSGIIRITNGGQGDALAELEKRYLVQRDGSVKIME